MNLPESRYLRRAILGLAALSSLLLVGVEGLLLWTGGDDSETVRSVASNAVVNLLTSLIAFAVVAGVATWLLPHAGSRDEVKIVGGRDRSDVLEEARRDTRRWWFSGGLGRYNRAVLMPQLAETARRTNVRRSVILLTLDPDHPSVCNLYARMRHARRSGQGQTWTEASVRSEVLATVLAAHWCSGREPMLEVEVRFKSTCSLTRLEVADTAAVRTSEDPQDSAIVYPSGTAFFSLMEEDFRLEREQARPFVNLGALPPSNDLAQVRMWLSTGGVDIAASLSDEEMQTIVQLALSEVNPYA